MPNIRQLWIDSPEPQKVVTTEANGLPKTTYKSVTASDLRKEMAGPLSPKVSELTIAGQGFTTLSGAILNVIIDS